jgi:hypothetical protein
MPYLWLLSVDGKLNYAPPGSGGNSPNVSVDASTLLDNLAVAAKIGNEEAQVSGCAGHQISFIDPLLRGLYNDLAGFSSSEVAGPRWRSRCAHQVVPFLEVPAGPIGLLVDFRGNAHELR